MRGRRRVVQPRAGWRALADDPRRAANIAAGLVVLGFFAVVLGPALLGQRLLLDTGILTRFYPWHAAGVADGSNLCRGDTIDAVIPQISHIRRGILSGDLPTWSPYTVGGTPRAALPSSSVMSPVMWPYFLLPLWLAPAFVKLAQMTVAIVGMVLLFGRLGASRAAGAIAGVVFVSCGFMLMWSNWQHTVVGCFIPLLFWAIDRAVRERRPRDAVAVAAVVACMLLGGFPAVTMYALTVAAVYALVRGLQARSAGGWRSVLGAAVTSGGGVALGVGLAAFQMVPFVKDMAILRLENRDVGGSLPFGQLFTVVAPEVNGTCQERLYAGPINPIEGIGFVGAAAIVLALCAVLLRLRSPAAPRRPVLIAVLCAVVLELVWIGGPPLDVLQHLPGYSANPIGRASSMFGFLAAVLAGLGLDRLFRRATAAETPARSRRGLAAAVLMCLAVVALIAWAAVDAYDAYDASRTGGVPATFGHGLVVPAVVLVVALAGVAVALLAKGRWRVVGPVLVVAAMLAQSTLFAHHVIPSGQKDDFYRTTASHRFLQERIGHDRYAGGAGWGYPSVSEYFRLRTPFGHAFHDPRWFDLLRALAPDVEGSPTYSFLPLVPDPGNMPLLDQFAVRYYAARPDLVSGEVAPAPRGPETRLRLKPREHASCEVEAGPLRGIAVRLPRALTPPPRTVLVVHVRATTSSGTILEGTRAINRETAAKQLRVAVPGEGLPTAGQDPTQVEVWFTGRRRPTVLRAHAAGKPLCTAVRPRPGDGLREVYADAGSVVYERPSALPRIRWAARSEVVTDPERRVEMLRDGVPDDTVLLESNDLPVADGQPADVDLVADEDEHMKVEVDAEGAGYLVVADAIVRTGWSATVDGEPVDITHGNHAFAAVPVPAGEHTVELTYEAPGLATGIKVSVAAAALALLLLVVPPLLARRRRRPAEPTA